MHAWISSGIFFEALMDSRQDSPCMSDSKAFQPPETQISSLGQKTHSLFEFPGVLLDVSWASLQGFSIGWLITRSLSLELPGRDDDWSSRDSTRSWFTCLSSGQPSGLGVDMLSVFPEAWSSGRWWEIDCPAATDISHGIANEFPSDSHGSFSVSLDFPLDGCNRDHALVEPQRNNSRVS